MAAPHLWRAATAVWLAFGSPCAPAQTRLPAPPTITGMDDLCLTPASTPATAGRSLVAVRLPTVQLRPQAGPAADFAGSLDAQRPVLLNFIFTSCTTVCPPLSQTFAAVQERLGAQRESLQMVSVSIDPEHDTPARLRDYAARFGAGAQWRFHTGSAEAVDAVQRAFNVYRPDKMGHTPVTFVRPKGSRQWVRLDGYAAPDELIRVAFAAGP
ncbi:SCO family protein [Sphaerotilus sp.]|uniref:SCO family protein n=1 Tax=Sphaerotilus sp. TaxID=2093942 RepID=UPI0034E1D662